MKKKSIKAEEFDQMFERGENIISYLDISQAINPGQEQKQVNVDFPVWMIRSMDKEAKKNLESPGNPLLKSGLLND